MQTRKMMSILTRRSPTFRSGMKIPDRFRWFMIMNSGWICLREKITARSEWMIYLWWAAKTVWPICRIGWGVLMIPCVSSPGLILGFAREMRMKAKKRLYWAWIIFAGMTRYILFMCRRVRIMADGRRKI